VAVAQQTHGFVEDGEELGCSARYPRGTLVEIAIVEADREVAGRRPAQPVRDREEFTSARTDHRREAAGDKDGDRAGRYERRQPLLVPMYEGIDDRHHAHGGS
jgi:hypothetical protein